MTSPPPAIERGRPLAPLTSWRIGGPAAFFAEPKSPEQLEQCLLYAAEENLPVLALGGGSNLLVADTGYPGLVLRYADRNNDLSPESGAAQVVLGAGHSLALAARLTSTEGWAGLEWGEGIPGTIGGAAAGNAGAFGGDISKILERLEVFSLEEGRRWLPATECAYAYRTSRFARQVPTRTFILSVAIRLSPGDPGALKQRITEMSAQRRSRTPAAPSGGSVFKNPPGDAAGRLIEAAGLKGQEHGGAQISPVHANYIVNRGGATAADVHALITLARDRVAAEFGITLELEIQPVGF